MKNTVFSVGHSSHSWEEFRHLIEQAGVDCIVDVRTSPTSRWTHFRKNELRVRLNRIGVAYLYLGAELGGHSTKGGGSYSEMARSSSFAAGIARVLDVAERCRSSLMCSEHEPLSCHRFLLIARHLVEQHGVSVEHILRDGRIEPHHQTEDRLIALHGGIDDLFQSRPERLSYSYRWQAHRLGMEP